VTEQPKGKVEVNPEVCNGCGLCVESCPHKGLKLSEEPNGNGVRPVQHVGEVCAGCGTCHYFCPETGAISVCRLVEVDGQEQYPPAA
jgi:2-oxoglutarate ferredoxin oxidoreductase subunit delta